VDYIIFAEFTQLLVTLMTQLRSRHIISVLSYSASYQRTLYRVVQNSGRWLYRGPKRCQYTRRQ